MRKIIRDDFTTKAKKRELKKRPRMNMHGAGVRRNSPHAGKKVTAR